jgi:hypothetical protein
MVAASVTRMPLYELALDAELLEQAFDLRTAAVHHHRIHSDQLEQHDVAREPGLQLGVDHRVAAELDDDRLAVKAADIRQRLGKDPGFVDGVIDWRVHAPIVKKVKKTESNRPAECEWGYRDRYPHPCSGYSYGVS